ncbi:MAG TPA: WHG domain-containing protein [Pseudonocardia sp.]|nr:WHG domain-containing protein [Pseudonocardia sp.]
MPRPKVHDDALRVRLLEEAVRTLSQDGPDGLSLRKLAAQVGTSTTAVYSLFGGKQALLDAVFDEAFARFGQRLASSPPTDRPEEDLYRMALAYRESALAEPHFYQVMFGQARGAFSPDAASMARAAATFEPLVEAVQRAMDAGLIRKANPTTVAVTLWGCVHGMVSLELHSLLPPSADDPAVLYQEAIAAIAGGWSAQAPRRSR